jgi:hypothetical protein
MPVHVQHCEDKGMNRDQKIRLPDTPAEAPSAPTRSAAVEVVSDTASPLARLDALAVSTLSSGALTRYHAYKEVLRAREQDEAAIVSTLTLFVWDLSEGR